MKAKLFMIIRLSIFLLIVLAWIFNFPHSVISSYVGSHFLFTKAGRWQWSGVLLESFLIESIVCIPFVFPIAVACRNLVIPASTLLLLIFIAHALISFLMFADSAYFYAFFAFQVFCHGALLVGGTYLARNNLVERQTSNLKMALN
jgi:hypothetical protein